MIDHQTSIPRRFVEMAAAHGQRLAIADGQRFFTYDQLEAESRRIAAGLLANGLDPTEPVYLLLDQGIPFISGLLGVLRAGLFYAPLERRNPAARNRLVLADSPEPVILTDLANSAAARDLGAARTLIVDDLPANDRPLPQPDPGDRAQILYTSGSTGRPKGVVHSHRNILHDTWRHVSAFELGPRDRQTLLYPCGVYGGGRDIFNALLSGASLWHYPVQELGVAPLPEWLRANRITVYCSVATVFRQLAGALDQTPFPDLRLVKMGGEAVFASDIDLYRRHFADHAVLSYCLATTEVGIMRHFFIDADTPISGELIPCGWPLDGIELLLQDEEGRPIPPGETGEIWVRSPYIALEYWRRPELTAQIFSPVADEPGTRLFRSGDLGRLLPDGQLEHRGRKDQQVKISGNRVELLDVERAILRHPAVPQAAVLARTVAQRLQLVAFYTAGAKRLEPPALRQFLGESLPPFMVPAVLEPFAALPLLPNGKIDRPALQKCPLETADVPQEASDRDDALTAGLQNEGEKDDELAAVLAIWRETLEQPGIGPDDSFFDLGGDSIAATQIVLHVEQRFGRRYRLDLLLSAPTPAQLAARIEADQDGAPPAGDEVQTRNGYRLTLLTLQPGAPDRDPLVLMPPGGGAVMPYAELAARLPREQPVYALRIAPPDTVRQATLDIEELGALAENLLLRGQPEGPYWLGGWSFGGLLAWELARRLSDRGQAVHPVIIIDTDCTKIGAGFALRHRWVGLVLGVSIIAANRVALSRGLHRMLYMKARRGGVRGLLPGILLRLLYSAAQTRRLDNTVADHQALIDEQRRIFANIKYYFRAAKQYAMPSLNQDAVVLATDQFVRLFKTPSLGWERFSLGTVHNRRLEGNHINVWDSKYIANNSRLLFEILQTPGARPAADRTTDVNSRI